MNSACPRKRLARISRDDRHRAGETHEDFDSEIRGSGSAGVSPAGLRIFNATKKPAIRWRYQNRSGIPLWIPLRFEVDFLVRNAD